MVYDLNLNNMFTAEELKLVRNYGLFKKLPYGNNHYDRLVDSIAHKLKMNKRYYSSMTNSEWSRVGKCSKRDAKAVRLYRKLDAINRKSSANKPLTVLVNIMLDNRCITSETYFENEIHEFGDAISVTNSKSISEIVNMYANHR